MVLLLVRPRLVRQPPTRKLARALVHGTVEGNLLASCVKRGGTCEEGHQVSVRYHYQTHHSLTLNEHGSDPPSTA